jgi:hypothetical protein
MGMKLKDLREWLKVVPPEYDDCQLVFRDIIPMQGTDQLLAGDDPITSATIDVSSREACFYNQQSYDLIKDIDPDADIAETLEPKPKKRKRNPNTL